jgi:hypothetical protein
MPSRYKLHIHRWVKTVRLNVAVVALAQEFASKSEAFFTCMGWLRKGQADNLLPGRPSAERWTALYRDHVAVMEAMAGWAGADVILGGPGWREKTKGLRELGRMARDEPEAFRVELEKIGNPKLRRMLVEMYTAGQAYYADQLKARLAEFRRREPEADEDLGKHLATSPELHFAARVLLPCAMVYRTYPVLLVRRAGQTGARQSDAVEALLRVDRMAVHLPEVERWQNEPGGSVTRERTELVQHWIATGLDEKRFSLKQFKQSVGGLIWAMGQGCGTYLSPEDWKMHPPAITADAIRELFHAVARDRAQDWRTHDEDLADDQMESWRKAIRVQRKLWRVVLKPALGGRPKSGEVSYRGAGCDAAIVGRDEGQAPNKRQSTGCGPPVRPGCGVSRNRRTGGPTVP